jgi:hypothetical protein
MNWNRLMFCFLKSSRLVILSPNEIDYGFTPLYNDIQPLNSKNYCTTMMALCFHNTLDERMQCSSFVTPMSLIGSFNTFHSRFSCLLTVNIFPSVLLFFSSVVAFSPHF